jgi:protocatechuate 3,4-dioxygenase beta subunit
MAGVSGTAIALSTHSWLAERSFAEALVETPRMTEGPFYPDKLPLDTDNDLLIINESISPSVGEITHLTGQIKSAAGSPLRNVIIEIWQVDNKGSYLHSRGRSEEGWDGNFQGYGRFMTDSSGRYYFRTIKPVPYGTGGMVRAPHIHVAVNRNGRRLLTTQLAVAGHELNETDGVFRGIRDREALQTIMVEFESMEGSKLGELTANFDIVLGRTLEEADDGTLRGGISRPERVLERRRPG